MHILFVTTAHNSLSQRLALELGERGHSVSVCLATSGERVIQTAEGERPDLIVAPMLKSIVPERVWRPFTCFIVHPGVKGDRGPSSLDWATTGAEQRESEPRSAKLARELPDVIATVPDDSDLVELIETGDSEDDAELLAETVDGDGMELSPEEAALHIVTEP